MANPFIKYVIPFSLIALLLVHVHACSAEIGISAKDTTNGAVKITDEYEVQRRRKGDGCVLEAPFNGEYMWCCVYGNPNEQRCYDTRNECQGECNRLVSKEITAGTVHQLNP